MADFKTYSVVYNITANSGEAYQALRQLAEVSKQLGNGKHMQNFNTRVKQLATYAERINKSMNTLSPRIDMGTFKSQLSIMERAVAASASNMRATIQTALSGTPQQFSKAIQEKGSWSKVAEESLRKEQKGIESALKNAKAKIAALRSDLTAGGTYREGANGKKQFLPFSQKDIAKANLELKTLGKTVSSYENRLSALASNLQVLGPAIPASVSKQFQSAGMVSQNVQSLNAMTEAMKKWKDVTKGMRKSQEYIININANDNTAPIFAKIEERLAAIKSAAASIVIGAASPGAAGKGTGKGGKATTPAPAATQTKAEDILTRGGLRKLKSMAYKTQNLADAFDKNGKWTDKQKELAKQILPDARKMAGITGGGRTAVGDIAKALNEKYDAEKKKYDQYKANKPARIPKQPKATTVTPQAPVQWPTQGPISVRSTFNGGGAAFGMNQSLGRLQGIANAGGNGVSIRSTFNGGGAAFGMNRSLYTLQELANTRPVSLGSRLDRSGIVARALGGYRTLQTAADQRPITLKSRFDATGLRFGLGRALVELQNMANSRPVTVRANITTTGAIPSAPAATIIGNTVNGSVGSQGRNTRKVPTLPRMTTGDGGGTSTPVILSRGTRAGSLYTGGVNSANMFSTTKRWLYPFTGNASFGASTPAFVEMAKGMGTMMALGGAMGAVGNSFNQSVDYQNMMTTTRAILGRNYTGNNFEKDFKRMEEVIRAEGIQTKFTAPEEAGAAKYLAMAGMDINTIKAAIRPVTNIALAGDMDLPTVADKMTNIMTAFKMKSPAEFVKASDILANTFTKSNTNMMQLAESAQYAAPIAAARGMGLAEMMALVGVMGDSGIQGSMAGTSLRMMMNNIYNPSKNQKEMWDQLATLGVSRTDSNGKWLGVTEILNQIASVVPKDKLPDVMGKLFRVTSVAGATQLARNIGRVNELRQSNNTAVGVAESMREARINNVRGKWAQVSSTFTEDMLRIFEKPENQEKIMSMLDRFREILAKPETVKALETVFDIMLKMADFMSGMASIALKLVNTMPSLFTWMLQMQMFMTAIGSYLLKPAVQFLNTFGPSILWMASPMGKSAPVLPAAAAATTTSSTAGAIAGGVLASRVARGGSVMGLMPNGTSKLLRTRSAGVLAAKRQAELGNILNATNMRQVRYEQIANRLSYSIEQQQLSNPDEHQSIYWMGNARVRAANHAAREAAAAAALRNRIAPVTQAEIMARYERMYGHTYRGGFLGRTGASMTRGFNAGRALTFASLVPSLAGLGGALTNVMSKVAMGFGMLLSQVGGAAIGLGGLVWAIKKARDRINEGKSEREKSEAEDAPGRERAYKEFTQPSGISNNTSSGIPVLGSKTNTKAIERGRLNPTVLGATGYNRLYKNTGKEGTNGYIREVYDKFIKNNSKYMYGKQLTFEEFKDRMWQGTQIGMVKSGRLAMQNALKAGQEAAVYRAVMERKSSGAAAARDEMKSVIGEWYTLPLDQREKQYPKLIKQLNGIRDRFNPENGIDISGRDFRGIRVDDLATSKQGIQAVWNILNDMIGNIDNGYFGSDFAKGTLGFLQPFSSSWLESMDNILSSQQFTVMDKFGEPQRVTLEFKKGVANWDKFAKEMQKLQVDFSGTVGQHLGIITEIAKAVANDPNLKDLAAVRQYLSGLLTYITSYDSKFKLSLLRDEMYNSIAPMPNVPVFKRTGENSSLPQSIRKPSQTVVNSSYWSQMNQQQGERDRQLQLKRLGIGRDQSVYSNSYQSKSQGKNSGPMLFSLNTPLVNIQNANVNSKEDAERIGNIAAEQFVNALSMISGSVNTQTEYS